MWWGRFGIVIFSTSPTSHMKHVDPVVIRKAYPTYGRKRPHKVKRGAAPESGTRPVFCCPAPAQELPDLRPTEADPARPSGRYRAGTGRWAGTGQEPGSEPRRSRAGTGRWAASEPGRNRAGAGQQPHGRTTPTQNWKTLALPPFQYFLHVSCSAEKWLTSRTRTCRGRSPYTSPGWLPPARGAWGGQPRGPGPSPASTRRGAARLGRRTPLSFSSPPSTHTHLFSTTQPRALPRRTRLS